MGFEEAILAGATGAIRVADHSSMTLEN